jgi:anti-anti-sigma regulatory factor
VSAAWVPMASDRFADLADVDRLISDVCVEVARGLEALVGPRVVPLCPPTASPVDDGRPDRDPLRARGAAAMPQPRHGRAGGEGAWLEPPGGRELEPCSHIGGTAFWATSTPTRSGWVITLIDDVDLTNEREANQELAAILSGTSGFVVVDLEGCFIGAEGTHALLQQAAVTVEDGRRFAVVKPPAWWHRVGEVFGMDERIEFFDSVGSALVAVDGRWAGIDRTLRPPSRSEYDVC